MYGEEDDPPTYVINVDIVVSGYDFDQACDYLLETLAQAKRNNEREIWDVLDIVDK